MHFFGAKGAGRDRPGPHGFHCPPGGTQNERRLTNLEWCLEQQNRHLKQLNDFNVADHKTLQEALQEQMGQLGELRALVYQEVASIKASHSSLLSEHTALKRHVRHMQESQCKMQGRIYKLQHCTLEQESKSGSIADILSSKDVICRGAHATRETERRRLGQMQEVLTDPDVAPVVVEMADSMHGLLALGSASRVFGGLRESLAGWRRRAVPARETPEQRRAARAAAAAPELDESIWPRLQGFEPSGETLDRWAKDEVVQGALGSFGVQPVMGLPACMSFDDVYSLFGQMDITLEQFVNRFTALPRASGVARPAAIKEKADMILRQVASGESHNTGVIECRDLFRLLELAGVPLQKFRTFRSEDEPEPKAESQLKIGSFQIRRQIGHGFKGICCYLATKTTGSVGNVALKWPASKEEVAAFQAVEKNAPQDCPCTPHHLDNGVYEDQPYLVTELLGSRLSKVFELLADVPYSQRLDAIRVIGRLVVRRLRSLHGCGYVHCDVSPENVLVGRARAAGDEAGSGQPRLSLYFVDLELAQRHPGGASLPGEKGSAEWSSIRSADGGPRLPEDDLEAVGWMMLNGLVGALPWFDWLQEAYKGWDSKWVREQAGRQAQRAKTLLLEGGWGALPPASAGRQRPELPEDLARFLRACRPGDRPGQPDYEHLLRLLGSAEDPLQADRMDLRDFDLLAAQLNRPCRERRQPAPAPCDLERPGAGLNAAAEGAAGGAGQGSAD